MPERPSTLDQAMEIIAAIKQDIAEIHRLLDLSGWPDPKPPGRTQPRRARGGHLRLVSPMRKRGRSDGRETATDIESRCLRLTDQELIRALWDETGELSEQSLGDFSNLWWLLGEAFERWAPEAAWAGVREQYVSDPPARTREELEAQRESWDRRAAARSEEETDDA
jgi:hypothetical protein